MSSKQVIVSQLVLPAAVGPVTDKRVDLVVKALGEATAVVARAEGMPGAAFVLIPRTGFQLQVSPDVVAAGFQGRNDASLVAVLPQVSKVLESLAAEVVGPPTVRMVGHLALGQPGVDVLKDLAGLNALNLLSGLADLTWGIGLRYFLEGPGGRGEYKVEPLVADRSRVYVEYVMSAAGGLPLEQLADFVQACEQGFHSLTDELVTRLESRAASSGRG